MVMVSWQRICYVPITHTNLHNRISLTSYWWGNAFNSSQWSNGASLIAVGLNWWQALIACMLANLISSTVALALGRPGARYHIGYPVLARSVFGIYGHYFFVWIRAVVAIIWFGVLTYFGSQHLSVIFRCIFGNSWENMPNHLPTSAGISSRDLLAFFLFWLIELPFQVVHPTRIKYLFAVCFSMLSPTFSHRGCADQFAASQAELIFCPLACLGTFAWYVNYGGGIRVNTFGATRVHGGALGWAMLNGISSCLGVTSALLVNVNRIL